MPRAADVARYTTIRNFFNYVARGTKDAELNSPLVRHRVSQSPRGVILKNTTLGNLSIASLHCRSFSRYAPLYSSRDDRDGQPPPARPSPTQSSPSNALPTKPSASQAPSTQPSPAQPSATQSSPTQPPSAQPKPAPTSPTPTPTPTPPPSSPSASSNIKNDPKKEPDSASQKSSPTQPVSTEPPPTPAPNNAPNEPTNPQFQNYSALFRRLALSLPHVKQPKKEDFLQAATSMWERMRIRFKWFTIRSFRRFSADDMSAFLSWFLVGQTLWILIGT